MLITSESVKHQIDIVNPYVKLLGSTDIMSSVEKKTPTVSPDQGATSATATIVPKELESEWLQFLKQKESFDELRKRAPEVKLVHQQAWFSKQHEELLKLLDSLHGQKHDEVIQDKEIFDRISDFVVVLFEYVKTLQKRRQNKCGVPSS